MLASVGVDGVVENVDATGVAGFEPLAATDSEPGAGRDLGLIRAGLELIKGQPFRPLAVQGVQTTECAQFVLDGPPWSLILPCGTVSKVVCAAARLSKNGNSTLLVYACPETAEGSELGVVECLQAVLPLLRRTAFAALGGAGQREWITPREQEILHDIMMGKSVPQIAKEHHRSPHTVHDHVKSLHRKLGATTRGELISKALGFINARPPAESAADNMELKLMRSPTRSGHES